VGTVDPAALGAELEFGEFRLRSDMADGGKQLGVSTPLRGAAELLFSAS
jgi:hypothetical protein